MCSNLIKITVGKITKRKPQEAKDPKSEGSALKHTSRRLSLLGIWGLERLQDPVVLAGVVISAITCIAAVMVVPEFRKWCGSVRPAASPTPAFTSPAATSVPTPTLIPSATPTATPTPTPTPIYLTVLGEQATVYSGSGEACDGLGQVHKGMRLRILGRSEDRGWWQVDYLGWPGWIAMRDVALPPGSLAVPVVEPPPTPINHPPVIQEVRMASTTIGVQDTITMTCQASDPDGHELTYTWEATDGLLTGAGDSVTYQAPDIPGPQAITATVRDKCGDEAILAARVEVTSASPPSGKSEPIGLFGQIWYEHSEVRRKLGWAIAGDEGSTWAVQESFEQGVMFWWEDTDEIYVLTQSGNWEMYMDTWLEGMDEYSCSGVPPRESLLMPQRGFGKVWCEQLGGSNPIIGWATTGEQGYSAEWQNFEHGFMWLALDGYVYVFCEDHSWQLHLPSTDEISSGCPGAPTQRVRVGDRARVCTAYDRLVVRVQPERSSAQVTQLEPGTTITVVGGPSCANGWSWWQVRTDSGTVGWVAEGGDAVDPHFVCPDNTAS